MPSPKFLMAFSYGQYYQLNFKIFFFVKFNFNYVKKIKLKLKLNPSLV